MRKMSTMKLALASAAIAVSGSVAAAGLTSAMALQSGVNTNVERAVPSSREGALPPPRFWDCELIQPEYEEWLDDGNTVQGWQYYGQTYRDVETERVYDWQDWLDWRNDACAIAIADPASGGLLTGGTVGTAAGITGGLALTGLLVALSGGGNDSPG